MIIVKIWAPRGQKEHGNTFPYNSPLHSHTPPYIMLICTLSISDQQESWNFYYETTYLLFNLVWEMLVDGLDALRSAGTTCRLTLDT